MISFNGLFYKQNFFFKFFTCNMTRANDVICLFDIDGTVTSPRQKISKEMDEFLEKLRRHCILGLVTGSDIPKVAEQFGGLDGFTKYDYIFSENGLVAYKDGQLLHTNSISVHLNEETTQNFINFALRKLSEIVLPFKRGTFIEYRKGMLNISPVGRNCTQPERDAFEVYDKTHKVRANLIDSLRTEFSDLNLCYSIGGQNSFDIFPRGWDKTYCIQFLERDGIAKIYFFGDKVFQGGNDHEIYEDPRTIGHSVINPEDTMEQVKKIFPV